MPVIKPGFTHLKGVLGRLLLKVTHFWRGRAGMGLIKALSVQNIFATCTLVSQYGGNGVDEEYK